MTDDQSARPRARYRFDPHTEGLFLGLGRARLALLLLVLATGVGALYGGRLLAAVTCTTVLPILVNWTREGIPALVWMPLRLAYRLGDADGRGWSLDPELVPHVDELGAALATTPGVPPASGDVPVVGAPVPSAPHDASRPYVPPRPRALSRPAGPSRPTGPSRPEGQAPSHEPSHPRERDPSRPGTPAPGESPPAGPADPPTTQET